ncbi:MAG TPA: hypothetical protein VFR81_07350 [Longimicrobium sp.]|nr:hypothetical protein [Longimicrobium sp.]
MNPEDNLHLARVLAQVPRGAPEEASFRGACGRAYYAAFGIARDLLLFAKLQVSADGSTHRTVIRLLMKSTDRDVRVAARSMDLLRKARNSADYDVGLRSSAGDLFDRRRAQLAVVSAWAIISTIRKASASDRRLGIPSR